MGRENSLERLARRPDMSLVSQLESQSVAVSLMHMLVGWAQSEPKSALVLINSTLMSLRAISHKHSAVLRLSLVHRPAISPCLRIPCSSKVCGDHIEMFFFPVFGWPKEVNLLLESFSDTSSKPIPRTTRPCPWPSPSTPASTTT